MNSQILEIPEPSLVLLIGSSGAGKSTFAARHFQPTEVISSDRCRAMICDDESDQSINAETFGLLHHITRLRLQQRKLTVIDATNLEFHARQPLLKMARTNRIPVVAIVFNVSPETCQIHNQLRTKRQVAEDVLALHQQQLQTMLSDLAAARLTSEGYSRIYVIEKSDLAGLAVRKLRSESENLPDNITEQAQPKH